MDDRKDNNMNLDRSMFNEIFPLYLNLFIKYSPKINWRKKIAKVILQLYIQFTTWNLLDIEQKYHWICLKSSWLPNIFLTYTKTKQNKIPWIIFLISINGTAVCLWNFCSKTRDQPRFFHLHQSPYLKISFHFSLFLLLALVKAIPFPLQNMAIHPKSASLLPYMWKPPSVIYFHRGQSDILKKGHKILTLHSPLCFYWLSIANNDKKLNP